jgi:hypothetical protein
VFGLHGLNGLAILMVSGYVFRQARKLASAPQAVPTAVQSSS